MVKHAIEPEKSRDSVALATFWENWNLIVGAEFPVFINRIQEMALLLAAAVDPAIAYLWREYWNTQPTPLAPTFV